MSRLKTETLSIHTSAGIKKRVRLTAAREAPSVAPMPNIRMLEYVRRPGLRALATRPLVTQRAVWQ